MIQVAGPQTGDTVVAGVPIFPSSASVMSGQVDTLFWFMLAFSTVLTLAIFIFIIVFAVKYRRRHPSEIGAPSGSSAAIETVWTVIPLLISLFMFGWGAVLYFHFEHPPIGTMQVFGVGKQWMWRLQHPEGRTEINELHVPVDRDIQLTMTSEDVIHDFFVPAFRLHADILPGRYISLWFHPTQTGQFHLFCSQYCGTNHSLMGGWVTVLNTADYQDWLSAGSSTKTPMASMGESIFRERSCGSCHAPDSQPRGPSLHDLYGANVELENGSVVTADDAYLRQSILNPNAALVRGYSASMPSYQGQLSEEQILQLIAYIKSLTTKPVATPETAQPSGSPANDFTRQGVAQ